MFRVYRVCRVFIGLTGFAGSQKVYRLYISGLGLRVSSSGRRFELPASVFVPPGEGVECCAEGVFKGI